MPNRSVPGGPQLRDRDPLLIPQVFGAVSPPWYRRGTTIMLAGAALIVAVALAYLVHRFGWQGTLARSERVGANLMTSFTRLVSR